MSSQPNISTTISPMKNIAFNQFLLTFEAVQNNPKHTAIAMLKIRVNDIAESASADFPPVDNLCQRIAVDTADAGEKNP